MKRIVSNSDKTINALNRLITSGYYKGYVGTKKIEFIRDCFPNNYRLVGVLNDDNNYELKLDFIQPLNIFSRILFVIGFICSVVGLVLGNWKFIVVFLLISLFIFMVFKSKERKEMDVFLNKLLQLDKAEEN